MSIGTIWSHTHEYQNIFLCRDARMLGRFCSGKFPYIMFEILTKKWRKGCQPAAFSSMFMLLTPPEFDEGNSIPMSSGNLLICDSSVFGGAMSSNVVKSSSKVGMSSASGASAHPK